MSDVTKIGDASPRSNFGWVELEDEYASSLAAKTDSGNVTLEQVPAQSYELRTGNDYNLLDSIGGEIKSHPVFRVILLHLPDNTGLIFDC